MADALEIADRPTRPSERRLHARREVRSIAYVELDEGNGGIVLNVSEGGLSVQAVVSLMDEQLPELRLQLPEPADWVKAGARIAWAGRSRKVVGLEFTDLPESARSQIREWVSQEALRPPTPGESAGGNGHAQQPAAAPIATQALVPPVEAVALSANEEAVGQNLPTVAQAVIVPPATAAEASANDVTSLPVAEPAPAAALSASLPALDSRLAPAPPAPQPIIPAKARVSRPSQHTEFSLIRPPANEAAHVAKKPSRSAALATLIVFLAVTSLAAGWAAGRGAFDPVLAWLHAMTSRASAVNAKIAPPVAATIAPVAEVQPTETRNPIPAVAPPPTAPASAPSPRPKLAAMPAPKPAGKPVTLTAQNLSPTIRRQRPDYASESGNEGPPLVADLPGVPENILPAAADNARTLVPPPQVRQAAVLKRPELIHRVDPIYPAIAREQRIRGTVTLHVTIGTDGTVREARALSGPPMLVPAALSAVRQWRYSPALLNGSPIPVESQINLEFRLP